MSGTHIKANPDAAMQLAEMLGAENVITSRADMSPFIEEPRRRYHTAARAVVSPRTIADVQRLVRWSNQTGTALIPQGGNTGLVGGQVPYSGEEVIVSLARLNKLREIDAGAGHMTIEAGATLFEAHRAAEEAGALFPLSIASEGSARIGGVLSTNAGGVQVLAYGNARELCLGVEAVMPDGQLYQGLNALRKNNTGYDLKDLLVGAEGTLGIITAATLKLFDRPEGHETALVNVESPAVAFSLFGLVRAAAGAGLTAFELVPRFGIDIQLKHNKLASDPTASVSPWYVLVEYSRPRGGAQTVLQGALEHAFEKDIISDAVVAGSEAQRKTLWALREQMSETQSLEGASIKHDVSVPVAKVPELIARGSAVAQRIVPGIRPCPFGHMGDGNIHFNFSQPEGADAKAFMAGADKVHDAIYEIIADLGGSISAEHGIGQLKRDLLKTVKDPVALDVMQKIKTALDPNNIMNPGKVL